MIADERSWTRQGYEWTLQHSLSFFFTAAVLGSRYETQDLLKPGLVKRILWFAPPLLLAAAWGIAMTFNSSGVPYDAATDQFAFVLGVVAALVPWVVLGIVWD